jgi:hypothetical protein
MDEPLAIPPNMRTNKERRLYSMRNDSILINDLTYGKQKIYDGDVIFLTDMEDKNFIREQCIIIADLAGVSVVPLKGGEGRLKPAFRELIEAIPYIGRALSVLIFGQKP